MTKIRLSERIRKPPRFITIEPYLREQDSPISSSPDARYPRIVPLVAFDYGSVAARFRQIRHIGKYMVKILKELAGSARRIRNNPYTGKTEISARELAELEEYARSLGVTDIGYTKINPAIYSGISGSCTPTLWFLPSKWTGKRSNKLQP